MLPHLQSRAETPLMLQTPIILQVFLMCNKDHRKVFLIVSCKGIGIWYYSWDIMLRGFGVVGSRLGGSTDHFLRAWPYQYLPSLSVPPSEKWVIMLVPQWNEIMCEVIWTVLVGSTHWCCYHHFKYPFPFFENPVDDLRLCPSSVLVGNECSFTCRLPEDGDYSKSLWILQHCWLGPLIFPCFCLSMIFIFFFV